MGRAGRRPTLPAPRLFAGNARDRLRSPRTGWSPHYGAVRGQTLAGAVPLYLKSHSRGEYVFDHAWADAFERYGLRYYPKLLSAVPFTPVTGPRLLAAGRTSARWRAR